MRYTGEIAYISHFSENLSQTLQNHQKSRWVSVTSMDWLALPPIAYGHFSITLSNLSLIIVKSTIRKKF